MVIDRTIRCDDDKVNAYLTELENEILFIDKSDVHRLIFSVSRMSGKIADYFEAIAENKSKSEIEKILPMSDKQVEMLIKIVDKVPKFKDVLTTIKDLQPEEINVPKEEDKSKLTVPAIERQKRIRRI